MEYQKQAPPRVRTAPRIIIHGGAGNITPANLTPGKYQEHREALLTIISKTHAYMHTTSPAAYDADTHASRLPSALETATFAVTLLENNPLFNSGHGAVFTRDGINELEASVMVSRGYAKRGVGITGLRRVKNPIKLAKALLEHGQEDLGATRGVQSTAAGLNVPSAQGHGLIHGPTAEALAIRYGLDMVEPEYFFTEKRWDEHVRGLEREKADQGLGTWSAEEYLPQGTCGAVALDSEGVICAATSTGGLTNKLTGRIGDTPVTGAGFWAEEFTEGGELGAGSELRRPGPAVLLSTSLQALMADCFPTPFLYAPVPSLSRSGVTTTRSIGTSGTGNGDSFMRVAAARTFGSIARFGGVSGAAALTSVAGPSGELQKSAEDRWGLAGEGEGGMIGIECVVVRDKAGNVVETRSEIIQDHNCGGMFRAWVDDHGSVLVRVWREKDEIASVYAGEGIAERIEEWAGEKRSLAFSI